MFDFTKFPNIETSRLQLRCLSPDDTASIFAVRSDYEVTKYNSGAAYTEHKQAAELIRKSVAGFISKSCLYWAILFKESGEVIGQMGFNNWDEDNFSAEVGFDLRRDCWGKGIMKEALSSILYFGITDMSLNRIGAQVSTYNDQCVHLLTRIGFSYEGTMRDQYYEDGKFHDLKLFAILKRDFPTSLLESVPLVTFVEPPNAL